MYLNNYNSIDYKTSPLQNLLVCCDRFKHEIATCEFDKQGRLLSLYGKVKDGADYMDDMEKKACHTLLDHVQFDIERMITLFKEQPVTIEDIFKAVPLFGERDHHKYPVVKPEDVPAAREKLEAMEILPLCGNRMAKKTVIDATEFAYIMKDLIIFDLTRMIQSFQNIAISEQMLKGNSDKRLERYQLMMNAYQANEWKNDQQYMREDLDDYISLHGYNKESLKAYLKRLEHDALNHSKHGRVATINHHYLNQNSHVSYIYHSRHQLTKQDIRHHFYFVNSRNLVLQEIELFDLRQPAPGAEANLFTNRAAKELVELLIPAITARVDFDHSYQYAAWVKAMMDLNLIRHDKSNRMLITNYVNKKFKENLDKSTLFRYLNKDEGLEKFKEQYELIMLLFDQTQDEKFDFLRKAL